MIKKFENAIIKTNNGKVVINPMKVKIIDLEKSTPSTFEIEKDGKIITVVNPLGNEVWK